MPTLYLWQVNDITSVGPDVFSNTSDGNGGAVGVSTFSIDVGATTHAVDVVDDDTSLQNIDATSQDIATALSFDGSAFSPGDNIQVEYSYIVRPVGSNDPADNVTVYGIRMANTVHGVASDQPLVPGVDYAVISISSNSPTVAYSSLSVCFAAGTLIDTPGGPLAVEELRPGHMVVTLDHGAQPVRWVRNSDQSLDGLAEDARPVHIGAGAFGRGLPGRDLIVSAQHRILVGGAGQLEDVFDREVFVPAKSLTGLPGIRHMRHKARIRWLHFACDRHEVVVANGCLSESLLLGPLVMDGLPAPERQALEQIFRPAPTPGLAWNGPPARSCLTVGAVRRRLSGRRTERTCVPERETRP